MRLGATLSAWLLAMAGAANAGDYLRPSETNSWSERALVIYRSETRSVERRMVRVWDPSPEGDLEFAWEPSPGQANGGIGPDGRAEGEGRLTWRIKGSASYDPRAVFSIFVGSMRNGRPEGRGRLELRSGEVVEGTWRAGRVEGEASWLDAAGNRYEGAFVAGRPHGQGRQSTRTGEIFTGSFFDGRRHGEGETRLAGGTLYKSLWSHGREIGANRPDVQADARIGGLIRAQSGGGDAGKIEIGIAVDERMNQQSDMRYQHLVQEEDIAVYPASEEINGLWNGEQIYPGSWMIDGVDWEAVNPAFVAVDLDTADGSRVKLQDLRLEVESSEAFRKPMLTLTQHFGCVGFRPDFSLVNHGWGGAQNARLTVQFATDAEASSKSRSFSMPVEDFDNGLDVSIRGLLDEAGVDTARLEQGRYTCPSMDSINVCRSQVFNDVGFGEIADFVVGDDTLSTTMVGTLDYDWADDAGTVHHQSEPLAATISLAVIEVPRELAECGDGFGGPPEALRYLDVDLPVGRSDYSIEIPVRGNRTISSYTARLKMHADQSSYHRMRVVADLADGSSRQSKPLALYYFKPRPVTFFPAEPAQCTLPPDLGGC